MLESLKPLSPTKPRHGRIMTMGLGSRTRKPWPILNCDHHRQEVNLLVEDRAYLQTTPLRRTKHFHVKGKLTRRFNNPRRDCYEMKEKTVASWSYHLSHPLCTAFSMSHSFGSASNFLTNPIPTRTSITEPLTSSLI